MKMYKSSCPELRLVKEKSNFASAKIVTSRNAADYCRQFFESDIDIYESMFLLLMNQANNTIGWVKISQGGVTGTVCDPMMIAKYAIEHLARNVILCHNHPSGNTQPSRADQELTAKIKTGLSYFDCRITDHIILTSDGFYSFADEGLL